MGQLMKKAGMAVAATAIAVGMGVAGSAAPASASTSAASFVTPVYGMTCYTGTSGSLGSYTGYATCYTPVVAKWKVRVSCTWGLNPESIWIYTSSSDGWRTLAPASTCYWGVNYVEVIEGR